MKKRVPVLDIADCTLCGGCFDLFPELFQLNDAGYVEVAELECYPEADVEEAIKYCPQRCIRWEDID
ncbi:MAG: ferredoxin [Desulfobacterales bacterium]